MSNLKWQKRPGEPFGFAAEFKRSTGVHYDVSEWQFFVDVYNRFGLPLRIELQEATTIPDGPWFGFALPSDTTKDYSGLTYINTVRKNRTSGVEIYDVYGVVSWLDPKERLIPATIQTGPNSVTVSVNETTQQVSITADTAILPIHQEDLGVVLQALYQAKTDAIAAKDDAQEAAQLAGDKLTEIINIATNFTGWIPVFGLVTDGARVVVKVTDWAGGHGTKPAVNVYLGATGPVTDIAQAVDIRGPIGFIWRGDYAAGTLYLTGDAFVFRGSAYRVNASFTAALPFDRTNVTRILRGTNPVGAWTATTQYYIDDLVTDSGNTYRRLTDGVSGASFSGIGADWAMWAQKGDPGTLTASAFAVAASYDLVNHLVVVQKGTTLEKMTRNALLDFSSVGLPAVRPTLMVDFANSRFVSPRVSFARSGTGAARYNAVRKFESIGANIPRIDYNRATGKCLGLLGESGTTNYSGYSVVPSMWGAVSATKTDSVVLAPDGSLAPTWTNTPNAGSSFVTPTTTGFVAANNTDYTYSFYAYCVSATNNGARRIATEVNMGSTNGFGWAIFDFYNITASKSANISAASIEDAGDGWYRCMVTFRADAAGSVGVVRNYIGAYGSTPETVTVSAWGAQLEPLPYATTLVPNTGITAVVRSAENPRILTDASWFNPREGTIIVDAIFPAVLPGANQGIISFNDGSMNNRLEIRVNSNNISAAGVSQASAAGASYTLGGVLNRYALSYKAGKTAVCRNGGTVATAATAIIPTITQLSLGSVDGGNANGRIWLPRVEYYPIQFSDSQLTAATVI